MEYCKTDLISSKGCVFVKYSKASSALRVLEEIAGKGMVSSTWCVWVEWGDMGGAGQKRGSSAVSVLSIGAQ
jgi:hypothetical protein